MPSVSAKAPDSEQRRPRRVVIVIYPGVTLLDAAGPAQVFASANSQEARAPDAPPYEVVLASPAGGQVPSDSGFTLGTVSLRQAAAEAIDTLIVSGGIGVFDLVEERQVIDWLNAQAQRCRRLASTCMGAFLTAEAGLVEGRTVTTHWRYIEALRSRYPTVDVQCDPLFVRSGKLWSSAGVTAGIDLALAMVEEDHGHAVAMQVAQSLVVFFKRPGGQSQFSNVLLAQQADGDGGFSELHAWIAGHLASDLKVETLARRAGMSPRSFARRYKERTGTTPAKAIEMMRVETAKRLLEQSGTSLARIALQTGLGDEQRLRRAFDRHVGVSPSDYRKTFGAGGCPRAAAP